MSFFGNQSKSLLLSLSSTTLVLLVLLGCEPESVRQEKALRRQLAYELRYHAYANASALARQLVIRAPHDEEAWKDLVLAEIELHDLTGAKQSLAEWRQAISSPSPQIDEYEGDVACEEQRFPDAFAAWEKIVGQQPANRSILEKIALLHQRLQHWTQADAAWSAAIEIGDDSTARINRAVCGRRLHHWKEAFEDLRRASELGPDDPLVRRWSRLFQELSKYVDQIGEFDAKLAILPDAPELLSDRALLFLRGGDAELALEDAKKAAQLAPWAVCPKLFQAIALSELKRGQEGEALPIRQPFRLEMLTPEFLENMSRLDSAISVERGNAEHYVSRGWQLNEIGQPKLALEDAETALRLDPKSAGALAEAGYALTKLGRMEDGFEKIKQATALDPNFAVGWQYRGELEMSNGNYVAAVDFLSRSLTIKQTVEALQKRAECYQHLGLEARANEDHRVAQQLLAASLQ